MAALIARAKAAPFGAGRKTKLDPRVRDGLTIRVEPGVSVVGFEPKKDGVLAEVQQTLTPDDDAPLEAELYAVNIYRPGGYFATHKDTPRGERMVGTLVVALP